TLPTDNNPRKATAKNKALLHRFCLSTLNLQNCLCVPFAQIDPAKTDDRSSHRSQRNSAQLVIPVKTGIQKCDNNLDSRLRGNDT
ncbi:MAG: hypothetical protein U9Q07_06425, partial [Planctomycetota bacterium]|nr:hypothetical protein [Planctomycetota bacterium]